MLEPEKDRLFIQLISNLAEPSALPDAWTTSTDSEPLHTLALKALYRLGTSDARKFLTVLDNDAPPNEAPSALLSRASRAAKELLPHLLRKYQELRAAEARETEHDRFLDDEASYDPFVEGTNFTRDSYSGRGELEAEPPTVLDRWGNVQQ